MKQSLSTQISWKFRRDLNSMLKSYDQIFGVNEAGSHLTQKKKKTKDLLSGKGKTRGRIPGTFGIRVPQ